MTIPSIGDILMLSQVAWKIGRAFTAGRKGAPSEFLDVETQINRLAKALKLLAEAIFADTDDSVLKQADKDIQDGVVTTLNSCQRTINDLDSLTDQYQVTKKHRTVGGFAIERSWSDMVLAEYKAMIWTTDGGSIQTLRDMLQMHTSTISLIMQALQSKSLSQLEDAVAPINEKIDHLHDSVGSLGGRPDEVDRIAKHVVGQTPQMPTKPVQENRPPRSLNNPSYEGSHTRDGLPSKQSPIMAQPQSPPYSPNLPQFPTVDMPEVPSSPTASATSSTLTTRKRISRLSFGGSSSQYSSSIASSDAGSSVWPTPSTNRNSYDSRLPLKSEITLPLTSDFREASLGPQFAYPNALLPPPAMTMPIDSMSISRLSLQSNTQSELVRLHRSSTTYNQRDSFDRQAFRNSAILCDVRGNLVEYTHKVSPEDSSHDIEMVQACEDCRIAVVRKREPNSSGQDVRVMTSIWVFSDNNTVRLQLEMADGEMYVPYSSYFSPEKISITVPCELKYHDVRYGSRLLRTAKTSWVSYVFESVQAATLFQNELMGRSLLGTYRTEKTMRVHEGLSGAFSYAEQMCGMENLRIWEDNDTSAVIALIHFSAHFRDGYLAFYLNSASNPIKVKDEGAREVKVKGLRVPLEKGALRKDSGTGVGGRKEEDKRKIVSGARIEFASEAEKRDFMALVREVQTELIELPDLLGVN
ncbi:hypothetical protein BDV95DRAFT_630526 [Massariosphaeria phaeospora]|uniref:Fungal N-terminal domain-containing protein n=1 Tax=Massariosphaeria phaeospora TaxID=100035 RepID=A0A7C8I4Z8_9PLEO|nr:hypothetical protein BDV95DRAFT_630526 [Massariosphaeria phaeospora]